MSPLLLLLSIGAGEVALPADETAWSFSNGPEFPGAAGRLEIAAGVVRVHYDFTGGGAYVAGYRALEPPRALRAVRFAVRKPGEAELTVRLTDATGQTFQKSVYFGASAWTEVEARLGDWSVSWGGAADGVFHQPATQLGVLIEGRGLRAPTGVLEIRDVSIVPGEPAAAPGPFRGRYQVTDFGPESGFAGSLANSVWTVDLTGGEAWLGHSISLFGAPRELRLTVRGGPAGARLTLHLGSHFQGFRRELGALTGGEQTFTVPAPPQPGWIHAGGEDDGQVRLPLRVTGLSLARGDATEPRGALDLVDLTCVTELPADRTTTLFASVREAGVAGDQRTLEATCAAWNIAAEPVDGILRLVVRDWDERVLDEQARPWTLPANGAPTATTWRASIPAGRHYAEATFTFEHPALRPTPANAGWTAPADDAGDPTPEPASPWGMGVYLYRNGNDPAGWANMDRLAALAQAAGVKWTREEFQWNRIETAPGVYDFSFYDQLLAAAAAHGVNVYALLAYWSPHYPAYTEAGIDAYCRWARALVARYKHQVKHWEIYNEPNIFFWSGPKELYPVLLTRAFEAIKAEDPEARVLGVSTAGIDRGFIARCLEAGAPFDILTIHPYRARLAEEGFTGELRAVREQVGGRPVWLTEMGWSTQIGGTPERHQAELLARCYLTAVASGAVRNMSWYNFRSDGRDPFYNEHNFGVLTHDLAPKPAYRALATICRTLVGGEAAPAEGFPAGVWTLRRGRALALWSPAAALDLACRAAGPVTVLNLMGETVATAPAGELTLALSPGRPIVVVGGPLAPGAATVRAGAEAPTRVVF